MLKLPNLDKPFIIQVDASDMTVREVLLQKNSKGDIQLCAYTSRKLSKAERH